MKLLTTGLPVIATLFFGAIFGFFYAWICSTMWAFDTLDPRTAIEVMQVVNEHVRNAVFFTSFMLTPAVGLVTTAVLFFAGHKPAAAWFGAATLVYLGGGLFLTMFANVPMNRALAATDIPADMADAAAIWDPYSVVWQNWNITRTVFSGLALALAGKGLISIRHT